MSKICIQDPPINEKYKGVIGVLKDQYDSQYYYLSTSIDVKKLGSLWLDFYNKVQGELDELSCVLAIRMLQEDDFAFAMYKEINREFITIQQALHNDEMNEYLDKAGLTDNSLAYLNGLAYFDELNTLKVVEEM